jgi:hypothetical protein
LIFYLINKFTLENGLVHYKKERYTRFVSSQPSRFQSKQGQMHYSDSSILVDMSHSDTYIKGKRPLLDSSRRRQMILKQRALEKTREFMHVLRAELGDGGALVVVLLTLYTVFQIFLLYMETFY